MVKGGTKYTSLTKGGKWFSHPVPPENETKTRETCTSTGIMLTQIKSSLPEALHFKRYSKFNTKQNIREYPISGQDNKHMFKDNILVFSHGVGVRKYPNDRREHNSHIDLLQGGSAGIPEEEGVSLSAYKADFTTKTAVDVPAGAKRFTRNHRQKSEKAASALAGKHFMWFGRDDGEP